MTFALRKLAARRPAGAATARCGDVVVIEAIAADGRSRSGSCRQGRPVRALVEDPPFGRRSAGRATWGANTKEVTGPLRHGVVSGRVSRKISSVARVSQVDSWPRDTMPQSS